jgi:hypothetical protein
VTGLHRMPSADGRTVGAALLGAVGAGLALVAAQVSAAVHADGAPVGIERTDGPPPEPATLAGGHLTAPHVCRCGIR